MVDYFLPLCYFFTNASPAGAGRNVGSPVRSPAGAGEPWVGNAALRAVREGIFGNEFISISEGGRDCYCAKRCKV